MNLTIIDDDKLSGQIFYFSDEYAFETKPRPPFWNSVLIDNLELILDVDGRVTGVWGLCPHSCWKQNKFTLPKYRCGGVIFEKFSSFESRIPISIAINWEVQYDNQKKWIYIGKSNHFCEHIEVLSGLILSIENNFLRSIWIRINEEKHIYSERLT